VGHHPSPPVSGDRETWPSAPADFFNLLNHPNFGSLINYLPTPQFGYATQMLNYLGSGGQSGGLNPLYQIGGPRSIQLALAAVLNIEIFQRNKRWP
jgi:hypothetical protein